MMLDEGAFLRLIELIQQKPDDNNDLHRLLIELLFEVSRIEKLDADDLGELGMAKSCEYWAELVQFLLATNLSSTSFV